ncbi:C1 family peptidase [Peredibacter starrii]|uniref:Peptidase C1A papain C-terminal domain-containing protein n=1 Tax=Peredibacter starrii TaxID=28202 RepID=A0AAX4HUE4_9BACT|nr:hypothetical protein [Peredibacter starrii]WPU67000.1 hypothetical protein SOO65_09575 [Peredibacter starrii]
MTLAWPILILLSFNAFSAPLPTRYTDLVKYVQPAPNQADTKSCWFVASTGAMELLLNKRDNIENPEQGGTNDLSEAFLIWQSNFKDPKDPTQHFIEDMVMRFNHGVAIKEEDWPFVPDMSLWDPNPDFDVLPRIKVPQLTTEFLFARGGKWDTHVLEAKDVLKIKQSLYRYKSPIIINYNDNDYWHVILIVGYDNSLAGDCYEIEESECNKKGAFIVRDSNGSRTENRAYNWFLYKANAAAVVRLKDTTASRD